MNTTPSSKWSSRSHWLAWGILILATGLAATDNLSTTWAGLALGVYGTWQGRRAYDNKLAADNGKAEK